MGDGSFMKMARGFLTVCITLGVNHMGTGYIIMYAARLERYDN